MTEEEREKQNSISNIETILPSMSSEITQTK